MRMRSWPDVLPAYFPLSMSLSFSRPWRREEEGTPSIVSRAAGYSDALKKIKHACSGPGWSHNRGQHRGTPAQETVLDYALAMDYFTWTYLEDEVKYRLLCEESFSLAKQFSWTEPVMEYYRNLVV